MQRSADRQRVGAETYQLAQQCFPLLVRHGIAARGRPGRVHAYRLSHCRQRLGNLELAVLQIPECAWVEVMYLAMGLIIRSGVL